MASLSAGADRGRAGVRAHGLPSSVNRGGLVATYLYDAKGRMARKTSFGLTFGFEWNADGL